MGNLPSTISCDPANPQLNPTNLYGIGNRLFTPQCQFDTTGPVLSISSVDFYDCINDCAAVDACVAVSWVYGTCYQKSELGNLVPSDAVSSFTAIDAGNAPTCPKSDGTIYSSTGNMGDFTIECGIDYPGIGDMGSSQQPIFQNCIDSCSTTEGCVAVAYSGDACYLKNAIGPATPNSGVQAAVLTTYTPPATTPATPASSSSKVSCPASDGTDFISGSNTYTIHCDADYFGGDLSSTNTDTFADCISACETTEGCIDVSYVYGSCYLKSELTTLSCTTGVWTAVQKDVPDSDSSSFTPADSCLSTSTSSTSTSTSSTSTSTSSTSTSTSSASTTTHSSATTSTTSSATTTTTANYASTTTTDSSTTTTSSPAAPTDDDTLDLTCPSDAPVSYDSNDIIFSVSCATDYYGGDFSSLNTDTLQECVDSCASNPACVALSYRGVACYLKSTLTTPIADPNVIGAKAVGAQTKSSSTTTTTPAATSTTSSSTTMMTTTTTTTTSSPTPTPLVNTNSCPETFSCRKTTFYPCVDGSSCHCFNTPTFSGFCSSQLQCNTACTLDADCGTGFTCAIDTCCPNANGSVCIPAKDPTCANTATAKFLFAKVKRESVWSDVLGAYIDKTPKY